MSTIDLAFITWPINAERIEAFRRCVESWAPLECDHSDKIRFFCSTETGGCDESQLRFVQQLCDSLGMKLNHREGTPDQGSNMNAAHRMTSGDFSILVMDDFPLDSALNVSPHCRFLANNPEVITVRYGWLFTVFTGDIPDTDLQWVNLGGSYPYATEPSLWRGNCIDEFGPWVESDGYAGPENNRMRQFKETGRPIAATKHLYAGTAHVTSTRAHRMDGNPKGE